MRENECHVNIEIELEVRMKLCNRISRNVKDDRHYQKLGKNKGFY
jgi:hypothetical protein